MDSQLLKKLDTLRDLIRKEGKAVVALSGGTDSSLLCFMVHKILGKKAHAVTACSEFLIHDERRIVGKIVKRYGIPHTFLSFSLLGNDEVRKNPPDRCYHCKKAIFNQLRRYAGEHGFTVVFDGTNTDDREEERPGILALRELNIRSPFVEAGLGKAEIIEIALSEGLEELIRPSNSCLATRISVHTPITEGVLRMVEKAEEYIRGMGFPVVRVRFHNPNTARIELPRSEIPKLFSLDLSSCISRVLKEIGFKRISVDIDGYLAGCESILLQRDFNSS